MELFRNHVAESMPNLSIKNVPPEVVEKLHQRAAAHHRSLQGELMALVTWAVGASAGTTGMESRARQGGHKSIEQIAAEHRERVRRPSRKGGRAVDLLRADRDAR
jgi:plasmid stability protein